MEEKVTEMEGDQERGGRVEERGAAGRLKN